VKTAYTSTVVVIPTRNRAAIAMNAIRSVLDQQVENVHVLVSDNSTSEADREVLASFCSKQPHNRLRYLRSPQSLAMAAHWDWAIQNALNCYPEASHFIYLTDRMMFRTGALSEITRLAALHPDKLISYNHDRIIDNVSPIRVEECPVSEKLLEIDTLHLSRLLSQSVFHPALPRMLNCIVPRPVLSRIYNRFTTVFSSVSPDLNFCCRCLEVEKSILFYDQSPIFHYALSRSNGASVSRGEMTPDYADFTANLPFANSIPNFATPIPQLATAVNYAFHEYCLFKQQTNSEKFFDLDMQKYLQANATELAQVIDPAVKREMLELLVANGYAEPALNGHTDSAKVTFRKRFRSKFKRVLTAPATTGAWLFLARTLSIRPPGENRFEFSTLDEAIEYARNISRGNLSHRHTPEQLLKARELPKR
jgi:glycosyltransferase involved in cell wall biosynthesis